MSFPRTGNVSLSGLNAARPLSQPRTPTSGLTSTSTIHQNIHSAPGTTNNVLTLQQRDHMVQLKEAQICTKVAQKVAHSSFIGKVLAHKMAQKLPNIWATFLRKFFTKTFKKLFNPWSSLVEGDEQMDWPKSQTSMECCHACKA